jgi:hypothetical protein
MAPWRDALGMELRANCDAGADASAFAIPFVIDDDGEFALPFAWRWMRATKPRWARPECAGTSSAASISTRWIGPGADLA